MINNLFIFVAALYMVIRGSMMATKHAIKLADRFNFSKYTVGFIIVATLSVLPETLISVSSAFAGVPSFGLGVLFGSNVADLTLVFFLLIFYSGRGLKVQGAMVKNYAAYYFLLLLPLILGFDGEFSRTEGLVLLLAGTAFYYVSIRSEIHANPKTLEPANGRYKSLGLLLLSMALLLIGSHFVVSSATTVATSLGVSPVLIGVLVVGLGTTMPELFFSLRSVKRRNDALAIGDLLGTVLADATIVVGILALVNPFAFPKKIIYGTGLSMFIAALVLLRFMKSGRTLTKREGIILGCLWVIFVAVEILLNS